MKYLKCVRRFVFVVGFGFVFMQMFSQSLDSLKINISVKQKPVSSILEELKNSYGIAFYYQKNWFGEEETSLVCDSCLLVDALNSLVGGKPYTYMVFKGNMVVFLPKEEVALKLGTMVDFSTREVGVSTIIVGNPGDIGKYGEAKLFGKVFDGKTGETLVGATIQIENTFEGAVSNSSGEYSMVLKAGIYNLNVSSIGYENTAYKIKIVGNGKLDIELFEESFKINEIAIYAQKADRNVRSSLTGLVRLDAKSIRLMPSATGESDVIKGLTSMPGVKSIGEFGSGINVRGGGEDQNLFLLEGAPLFNTSHVLGLISVINPDAVNSLALYKGHIPSGFGERVSSVVDIQVKDNNCHEMRAKGGIGIYNSRLLVEGPLLKEKITYKIGGRTSYSNFLLHQIPDYALQNSAANFYDINALININLKNDKISLFSYSSHDYFKYATDFAYKYGNQLASLSWNHIFNPNLVSSVSLSSSILNTGKEEISTNLEQFAISSKLNYLSGKMNVSYNLNSKHVFDAGLQIIHYQVEPGKQEPLGDNSLVSKVVLPNEQAFEGAFYLNSELEINKFATINAGLRWTNYYCMGPGTVWQYVQDAPISELTAEHARSYQKGEFIAKYGGPEPRASFKYQFKPDQSFKFSYNHINQYLSLISYSSVPSPDDIWKLADNCFQPVSAHQIAGGYFRNFSNNTLETSIEGYYKKLDNLVEYKNNAQLKMNPSLEREIINATGKSYGVEFMVKKNQGKLDGWLSYTYSRALKKTNGRFKPEIINSNQFYPSAHDKPHDLSVVANYNYNRRLRFTGNFAFASGRPVTLPEYAFYSGNNRVVIYSARNNYRLPNYHRLDLSVSYDESLRIKKRWKGRWTFSVLNVYARKNAYSLFYKKELPSSANHFKAFNLYKLYMVGVPFPTLTYNFIFK